MKIIRIVSLLTLLLLTSSCCFADVGIERVSKEQAAKDFGATIRTKTVGTNQVGVWLEFTPKGKLQTFSSVLLEITSGERTLVSATLAPSKQTADAVVVFFMTDPAHLSTSKLTILYRINSGYPPYDAIQLSVADFIKHESSR
jgi:uncharacterized protein YbaA (DUF1428 family)